MVTGFPDNRHKGFETFSAALEWLSMNGHSTFHFWQGPMDGPKSKSSEDSGQPECYLATGGRGAAIFGSYSDVKAHVYGCRNATQKSYADRKTAKAVLRGLGQLEQKADPAALSDTRGSGEGADRLIAEMANVSLNENRSSHSS
ncbi:hypothetical protein N8I77_000275 [Diaporthe amygdali]|uniref:Ribonuclease H1 N-terminal domain-containing protein n=1 Tax=Phomopsis amygdali TaxID=1214568 RepID=A0AAD9SPP0_PHOAM|nr:hypothetical protein N8I77_000275 [Diaporthe amygdali]